MSLESVFFKRHRPVPKKLEAAGFRRASGGYTYEEDFLDGQFRAVLTVSDGGEISGRVIDLDTEEEYLPIRARDQIGEFVGSVRQGYFEVLDNGNYRVIKKIRDQVVFKKFNLMNEIVYKKPFDLISCRNVMIYFEQDTKEQLEKLGFSFPDSKSNFIFAKHSSIPASDIFEELKKRDIYVRYFSKPERISNYLRISIGTEDEMQQLINTLKEITN